MEYLQLLVDDIAGFMVTHLGQCAVSSRAPMPPDIRSLLANLLFLAKTSNHGVAFRTRLFDVAQTLVGLKYVRGRDGTCYSVCDNMYATWDTARA